jgi:hypothetical protein
MFISSMFVQDSVRIVDGVLGKDRVLDLLQKAHTDCFEQYRTIFCDLNVVS